MQLEHVACDLCGESSYRLRYRKPDNWLRGSQYEFPVVECRGCGLVYVNPRPTPDAMGEFYPEHYYEGRDEPAFLKRYEVQRRLLPILDGKQVLDIGCARGDFLAYLLNSGEDFAAYGVDAFSPGIKDDRISFTKGNFDEAGFRDAQFDVVMSWAVFEHLHRPSAYFREAARVLKSGGSLVILVTNADSLYGRFAYTEDVPRHTYHYSTETLAAYGTRAGLKLRSIEFTDELFDGRGSGTLKFLLGRLFGFTWEKDMLKRLSPVTRVAMLLGRALDMAVFRWHWEARLKRSGVMVATYEKE